MCFVFCEPLPYYEVKITTKPMFKLGEIVATNQVKQLTDSNKNFKQEIDRAFNRFIQRDWGVAPLNSKGKPYGVKNGEQVIGWYDTSKGMVYIITEGDRRTTTILFSYEY